MSILPIISSILIFSGIILYVVLLLQAFLRKGNRGSKKVNNVTENIAPLSFKGVPETAFQTQSSNEVTQYYSGGTVRSTAQSILTILSTMESIGLEDLIAKLSDRSKNYVTDALRNLEREGLIEINAGIIMLTDKASKTLLSLSEKKVEKET
ncbi:MAG: hypothetical protein N3F64_03665 [Nitrososphaeria archaeon]|nr:hypothetical protein [Nitrososphaeria archaeon]